MKGLLPRITSRYSNQLRTKPIQTRRSSIKSAKTRCAFLQIRWPLFLEIGGRICDHCHGESLLRTDRAMIIVVGMAFEARIAAQSGLPVVCAGNRRDLGAALHDAIGPDCKGLVSFGVAGGLKADLPAGTCGSGSAVVTGNRRFVLDREWSEKLLQRVPGARSGIIAGVPAPVATAAAKHALHRD